MTSNLLGRLGSCVLSVLSGKGPHAALETPPGSEAYIHTACPEHYDGNWLARLGITTVMIRTRHVVMCVLRRPCGHFVLRSPLLCYFPTLPP